VVADSAAQCWILRFDCINHGLHRCSAIKINLYLVGHARELQPSVYPVPDDIDREIARLKLAAMHIAIDSLTAEQAEYLGGWESGTR